MQGTHLKKFIEDNFHNCGDETVEKFRQSLQELFTIDKNISVNEEDDNWDEGFCQDFSRNFRKLILSVDEMPKWIDYTDRLDDCIDDSVDRMKPKMFLAYVNDGGKINMTDEQIKGLISLETFKKYIQK